MHHHFPGSQYVVTSSHHLETRALSWAGPVAQVVGAPWQGAESYTTRLRNNGREGGGRKEKKKALSSFSSLCHFSHPCVFSPTPRFSPPFSLPLSPTSGKPILFPENVSLINAAWILIRCWPLVLHHVGKKNPDSCDTTATPQSICGHSSGTLSKWEVQTPEIAYMSAYTDVVYRCSLQDVSNYTLYTAGDTCNSLKHTAAIGLYWLKPNDMTPLFSTFICVMAATVIR